MLHVLERLVTRCRNVERRHEPPAGTVWRVAELRRPLGERAPVVADRVEPAGAGRADRDHAEVVLAGQPGTGWADDRCRRHLEQGVRVGVELQTSLNELVAGRLDGQRLVVGEQVHEDRGVLLQGVPLLARLDTDHVGIRAQRAWPQAEHGASPCQVVQEHHPIGHPQRVVVRQRQDAGAQVDVPGQVRHVRDEHQRVADGFDAARVVLAEPRLLEAHAVHQLDDLDIPGKRVGRVLLHGHVMRGNECAETQPPTGHLRCSSPGVHPRLAVATSVTPAPAGRPPRRTGVCQRFS